ncbi:MAG: DUF5110 domain-containing protein [Oscillospiraceae bacterium]|nr:DUF5110 domain-containing protein [Oscillospiraceae bacterium]
MKKLPEHLIAKYLAPANDKNIVCGDKYRFTVLTSQLIRLEYCEDGVFEDATTQSVVCRDFDDPSFEVTESEDELIIETEELVLTYKKTGRFAANNLSILLKRNLKRRSTHALWQFSDKPITLGGTRRTLDDVDGAAALGDGVCSRGGYAVLDDSKSATLCENGLVKPRKEGVIDLYFFGYGYEYLKAVQALFRLTGEPPLLPAYALGNWWSRYYTYTQQEYIELMERFTRENVPFSVAVIDMDWHTVDIPAEFGSGWTGYSWNKDFFPDYKAFLKWLHEHNLRVTLNLHPALGVRAHEDMYKEMAEAIGVDPESREPIVFDMTNIEFIKAYFEVLHKPYEKDGVDFWWMDWQQGTKSAIKDLDPLWLLNHYHTLDIMKDNRRPMLLSRFSGAGSQRYPIGFSGDTKITWDSLDFQPYFTATASNIGYPWWSHDIGGHYGGKRDDMLTTRWVQLGVFSPINRLHSSNSPFSSKEPWNYGVEAEKSIKKFLTLRHRLFPYLYTMNYRTHKDLIPLCLPLYYENSDEYEPYSNKNAFYFGSEMLVFPIASPSSAVTGLGKATGWLPHGKWYDLFTGARYEGGRQVALHRNSDEYPVLCKAGAVVPMNIVGDHDNTVGSKADMELFVFAGADNTFTLYEDAGEGFDYQNGAFATTKYTLKWSDCPVFEIKAAEGNPSLIPEKRNYKINFRGVSKDTAVKVICGGREIDAKTKYGVNTNTVTVCVRDIPVAEGVRFELSSECGFIPDEQAIYNRIFDILMRSQMDYNPKNDIWPTMLDKNLTRTQKLSSVIAKIDNSDVISAICEQLSL